MRVMICSTIRGPVTLPPNSSRKPLMQVSNASSNPVPHFQEPAKKGMDRDEVAEIIDLIATGTFRVSAHQASGGGEGGQAGSTTAHSGGGQWCSKCGATFSTRGNLNRHHRTAHDGIRVFCDVPGCGQSFSQLADLKRHKRRLHAML